MYSLKSDIPKFFNKSKLFAWITTFTTVVNLFFLVSLTFQPIKVEAAETMVWAGTKNDKIITRWGKNQSFRDHLSAGYGYNDELNYSLIKFNGSLPDNAIVTSANLQVYQYSEVLFNNRSHSVYASTLNNDWSMNGTNAWGQPGFNSDSSSVYVPPGQRNVAIDITGFFQNSDSINSIKNRGLALRSNNTNAGGSYCSSRNDDDNNNGGSNSRCFPSRYPKIVIQYTTNDAPNKPIINTPDAGMKLGGEPYTNSTPPIKSNPTGTDGVVNLVDPKNCTENVGCDVRVDVSNIWDPNVGTPGELSFTRADFVPINGKGQFEREDITGYQPNNQKIFTRFIKDGKYNLTVTAYDKKGLSNTSSVAITIDTTDPNNPVMQSLPEFSKGLQNEVFAAVGSDVQNLSEPITYDFCRSDNESFTQNLHCSSTGSLSAGLGLPSGLFKLDANGNATVDPYIFQDGNSFGFGSLEEKKYFYKVRYKDSIGNVTGFSDSVFSTQDNTLPAISDLLLNGKDEDFRLSPKNQDSSFDDISVGFKFVEKYPKSARFELLEAATNQVVTSQELTFNKELPNDENSFSYSVLDSFKGKDKNGNWLADGAYKLQIVVEDKAGNLGIKDNRYIVVDNTPGNISLSTPKDKTYTNQKQLEFAGQIISEDSVRLFVDNILSQNFEVNLDLITKGSYLFNGKIDENLNLDLNLGQNLFQLKTIDSVDNVEQKTVTIIREEEAPNVSGSAFDSSNFSKDFNSGQNLDPDSNTFSNYTPADSILTKNRKPRVSFDLKDLNTQGHGQAGINKDSINLKLYNNLGQEQILVTNGGSYVNPIGKYISDCKDTSETEGSLDCKISFEFQNELQPDGEYFFGLDFQDRAGNSTSIPNSNKEEIIQKLESQNSDSVQEVRQNSYSFYLDSFTFLETNSPINNNLYARKNIVFEGLGEKGSTLKLTNSNLNQSVSVVLDQSNNDSYGFDGSGNKILKILTKDVDGLDSFVQSQFKIVCEDEANFRDFDNSELTGNNSKNPVCKWQITLNQANSNTTAGVILNQNQITLTDDVGNIATKNIQTQVDLFAVDIAFKNPAGQFISADGNGRQDDISFETKIQNPNNSEDKILVDTWKVKIFQKQLNTDGQENGELTLVRTLAGSNSFPNPVYFDGKDDGGNWLKDGNYTYELDLDTVDNPNLPTISGSFQNITKNTLGLFITYPSGLTSSQPFVTTQGVINVQGQANLFVQQDNTQTQAGGLTYKDIQVKICVDTIGLEAKCDFERIAEVDKDGFFTNTVNLTRLNDTTDHQISARIVDKFGNESELSNTVYVRTNTLDPFKNIQIIPTYSGVSKPEEVQKLRQLVTFWQKAQTGSLEKVNLEVAILQQLKQLRVLKLKSTVTQDTQFVKLNFDDLTNVSELSDQTNLNKEYIGWMDNTDYNFLKHSFEIPFDQNGTPKTQNCDTVECTWTFDYPIPSLNGGFYQVDFTGRKGGVEQTLTAGFTIDSNILITPTIFDINKVLLDFDTQKEITENTREFDNQYYTNNLKNEIVGFANPDSQVTVKNQITNQIVCQTQTSKVGIFSCVVDLPLDQPQTLEQEFQLTATASLAGKTENSQNLVKLFYDIKAPELTGYKNINNEHSKIVNNYLEDLVKQGILNDQNGISDGFYRQGGDRIEVKLEANENLAYGKITNRYEKFEFEQKLDSQKPSQTLGYFDIEGYSDEGNYQIAAEISDRAGNKTTQNLNYFVDNQIPDLLDQNKTYWGDFTAFGRRGLKEQGADTRQLPANNRLLFSPFNTHYALKDDSVIITGEAEMNTYPILIVDGEDYKATQTIVNQQTCKSYSIDDLSSPQKNLAKEQKTAPDGSITKSSTWCQFQFEFRFKEEKVHRIQLAVEDKSGNRSQRTGSYLIEHDKTKPNYFSINNASSDNRGRLIDWNQNGDTTFYGDGRGNLPAVTNRIDLKLDSQTEQLTDVEYYLVNPQGQTIDYQQFVNSNNTKHQQNLKLGDKTADRDGQAGLAEDGYYQILYRSGDSADNETDLKSFLIERDTLTPNAPNLNANLNFSYKSEPYYISGFISGEPYRTYLISFLKTVSLKYYGLYNGFNRG